MKRWRDYAVPWIAVFGLIIACSFAQSPVVSPISISTVSVQTLSSSPTSLPHPTRTSPSPPPSTTTTIPSPSPNPVLLYGVADDKNRTCLLMRAEISVELEYTTENGSRPMRFQLSNNGGMTAEVDPDKSYCTKGKTGTNSYLVISWTTPQQTMQYLMFQFARQQHTWKMSAVRQLINATDEDFVNMTGNATLLSFSSIESFFTNEYERSYKCKKQSFTLTNDSYDPDTILINMTTVELRSWKVQAFEFRDNDTFGNSRDCPMYAKKNIKLPIIIGALLAVFLMAIIVVYVISRFRKRRLTHYESLN